MFVLLSVTNFMGRKISNTLQFPNIRISSITPHHRTVVQLTKNQNVYDCYL